MIFSQERRALTRNSRQNLKFDVPNESTLTATQDTNLQHRRTALLRQIQHFREVQAIYMIDVEDVITRTSQDTETEAEDILLFMPSGLNRNDHVMVASYLFHLILSARLSYLISALILSLTLSMAVA